AARPFAEPLAATTALQDPTDWWAAAAEAGRAARRAAPREGAGPRLSGSGVASTSCTMLPARRDGTPLSATGLAGHPHAWPKLWKHHGAAQQAERMTALAVERDE